MPPSTAPATLGVIGIGAIAEAMVTAYCLDQGHAPIVLSPRSASRARALADRYANVSIARNNQALVDSADTVIVCLRPDVASRELTALRYRPGQSVISVVAGASMRRLAELVEPGVAVARAIPMPAIARREGVTAVYSPGGEVPEALAQMGETVVVSTEPTFDALSAATATIAAHYRYLSTIADWLVIHGATDELAQRYVRRTFDALSAPGAEPAPTAQLAHATPGGINAQFLESLDQAGVYRAMSSALDLVYERITTDRS